MTGIIHPGERTRAGVIYGEQTRAGRIWARCCAIMTYAPAQPWSSLARLNNRQVAPWLLKQSGMPHWLISSFTRLDAPEIAAALSAVHEARREPQLADWLDRMAAAMPSFSRAEPKGEPEFQEVA